MKRTNPWLRIVAALMMFSLIAAACGGDDDEGDATSTESSGDDAAAEEEAPAEEEGAAEEAAAGDRSDWPDTLTFGSVPAENAENLAEWVTPQILSDELGIEIEFLQAADYAGVIEGMIAEKVDIGGFGAFSYVIATGNGADIDVAGVWAGETPDVIGDYRSYAITQADNDEINSLEDFAGKTICFVDPGSTSGFLFPSEGLLSIGLDPNEGSADLNPTFAGGHDAAAIAVANGDCDAGYAYDAMVTSELIADGAISGVVDTVEDENVNPDDADLKIVWKSLPIAAPPIAVGNWLPEDLKNEIVDIITTKVNIDWAAENGYCEVADETCILSDGFTWGFLPSDDTYFDGIRQLCEVTGSARCEG